MKDLYPPDVVELLWISIEKRKTGTLHLNHDAVSFEESVQDNGA
jgi:hypothetical protein